MTVEAHLGPSTEGSVVLDVGGDIGAVVVYTPDGLLGSEIEIVRRDGGPRVHTEVRARLLPGAVVSAAVFPDVARGDYTLLGLGTFPSLDFSVEGGRVTELSWLL